MTVRISHPTDRPNFSIVTVGDVTITFSYETPIAFCVGAGKTVARINDWSATTGKHLNATGVSKEDRVPGSQFLLALDAVLNNR